MAFGDRYTLELPLGEGDLGTVWLARDKEGARVVVATLDVGASDASCERFEAHAKALVRINHPNVVKGIEEGITEGGERYLVMEKLEGESLAQRWSAGPALRVDKTIELGIAIVSGLAKVHGEGIAHGDIEPGNVYLAKTPRGDFIPKLIGFGLNRVTARNSEHGRASISTMAAFAYAAPEQVAGAQLESSSADLYSAAALVFAGLSGRTPHQGTSMLDLAEAISHRAVPPLATLKKELTAFSSTLERALQNDPTKRFPDAAALERGLRAALAMGRIMGARETSVGVREAVPEAVLKSVRPPSIAPSQFPRAISVATSPGIAPSPAPSSHPPSVSGRFPSPSQWPPSKAPAPSSPGVVPSPSQRPPARSPLAAPRAFIPPPSQGLSAVEHPAKAKASVPPPRPREDATLVDSQTDALLDGLAAEPAKLNTDLAKSREDSTVPLDLDAVTSLGKPPPTPHAPRESEPSERVSMIDLELASTELPEAEAPMESAKHEPVKHEPPPPPKHEPSSAKHEPPPPPKPVSTPPAARPAPPMRHPSAGLAAPAPTTPRALAPAPLPSIADDDETLAPSVRGGPPQWLIGALGGAAVCLAIVYVWMQFRAPQTPVVPPEVPVVIAPVAEPPVVIAQPAVVEPVAVEPVAVEPVAVEPVAVEPVVVEPVAVEPVAVEPTVHAPATPHPATTTRPLAPHPTTTRPATTRPATTRPATTRPATTRPATTRPATTRPASTTGRQTVVTDPGF